MYKDVFNSATIESMLKTPSIKWRRDPPDVIGMWIADPDFPQAPFIKKAVHDAVDAGNLYYWNDNAARKAMAERIVRHNGLKVTADDVYVMQGILPGMWLGLQYCKANPGDEVIVNDPMYHLFFMEIETGKLKPVYWKLHEEEGYRFDIEELKEVVNRRTKLIFVCNPHNPTGRVMTKEGLKGIADVAVDHKIPVMSDELWDDVIFDGRKHVTLATLNPEIADITMTSFGISKAWGVPGLQCGYLAATNKKMMEEIKNHAKGILHGTGTLSLAASQAALDKNNEYWLRDMMKHLHKVRDLATRRLTNMGCTVPELQGTYLMFPKFNVKMKHDELYKLMLEKAKVGLGTGSQFGPEGEMHLRMTIATSEAIMNEALDRIERVLKTIK